MYPQLGYSLLLLIFVLGLADQAEAQRKSSHPPKGSSSKLSQQESQIKAICSYEARDDEWFGPRQIRFFYTASGSLDSVFDSHGDSEGSYFAVPPRLRRWLDDSTRYPGVIRAMRNKMGMHPPSLPYLELTTLDSSFRLIKLKFYEGRLSYTDTTQFHPIHGWPVYHGTDYAPLEGSVETLTEFGEDSTGFPYVKSERSVSAVSASYYSYQHDQHQRITFAQLDVQPREAWTNQTPNRLTIQTREYKYNGGQLTDIISKGMRTDNGRPDSTVVWEKISSWEDSVHPEYRYEDHAFPNILKGNFREAQWSYWNDSLSIWRPLSPPVQRDYDKNLKLIEVRAIEGEKRIVFESNVFSPEGILIKHFSSGPEDTPFASAYVFEKEIVYDRENRPSLSYSKEKTHREEALEYVAAKWVDYGDKMSEQMHARLRKWIAKRGRLKPMR